MACDTTDRGDGNRRRHPLPNSPCDMENAHGTPGAAAVRKRPAAPIPTNQIIPGDTLILGVPPARMLPPGKYTVRVDNVRRIQPSENRYVLSWVMGRYAQQSAILTIYDAEVLRGQGFLGDDMYPVSVIHEPNLEERLRLSLDATLPEGMVREDAP